MALILPGDHYYYYLKRNRVPAKLHVTEKSLSKMTIKLVNKKSVRLINRSIKNCAKRLKRSFGTGGGHIVHKL